MPAFELQVDGEGLPPAGIGGQHAAQRRRIDAPVVIDDRQQRTGTRAHAEHEEARQLAPGDWRHKNIQIVVATKVIGEEPGAPRVVAAHLW